MKCFFQAILQPEYGDKYMKKDLKIADDTILQLTRDQMRYLKSKGFLEVVPEVVVMTVVEVSFFMQKVVGGEVILCCFMFYVIS